ncbi:LD-carboxypeptidase [Romboutsia weinsteinii]|uniref:LD-carboxypeptidase n=1 Tax=Romboutsia weinsteinii TaxID=2020949 RepID=A0A371IYW6_9FIRM|nr:LD-carboxypeptidase [Romboutsia weinsteinii]RDY25660.1 LD-carboxypeptidase [Romboutsia weinsteinii]
MIFPKSINKNDTIGIVAPSGPFNRYSLEKIKKSFKKLGYKVKFADSCIGSYKGYLSAEDEIRAKDIEDMFLDNEIDAIMCIRGGYGTPRILDKLNYNIIKDNPKPFIGFSDITALHTVFNQRSNLVTFHGIMAGSVPDWDEFTYKSLLDALNMKDRLIISNPNGEELKTLVNGKCEGIITGGNLSLLVSTIGTPYEIDTKGKVLFIEEIGETIYKLDRMLTQLSLAGKFDDCEGIVFGDFCECNKGKEDFELVEILRDRVEKFNKPCIYNLKSGHCMPMVTIPMGVKCKLDASVKILEVYR